jgi:hypothetical protein
MTEVGAVTMNTLNAMDVNVFIESPKANSNPRKVIKQGM